MLSAYLGLFASPVVTKAPEVCIYYPAAPIKPDSQTGADSCSICCWPLLIHVNTCRVPQELMCQSNKCRLAWGLHLHGLWLKHMHLQWEVISVTFHFTYKLWLSHDREYGLAVEQQRKCFNKMRWFWSSGLLENTSSVSTFWHDPCLQLIWATLRQCQVALPLWQD